MNPDILFYGVSRFYARYRGELLAATDEAMANESVFNGTPVARLEAQMQGWCRRRHAVALGSCTDGLTFALSGLQVGPGDEVLVPALTFAASVLPILRVGATPVFVDIDPGTFLLDIEHAERLVTGRTKALIGVDLFGQALPARRLADFAAAHRICVIEDAAQAFGASSDGLPAGALGDASCLSFDPTKVVGVFGSGGMLLTDDSELASHACQLRNYGRNAATSAFEQPGYCSRLSSSLAAQLLVTLGHFPERQRERERVANRYRSQLHGVGDLLLPEINPDSAANCHKFVVRSGRRNALRTWLKHHGIETAIHYPCAACDEPMIQRLRLPRQSVECPQARAAADSVLSLPIYPELLEEEVAHIARTIQSFFGGRGQAR